MLSKLNREELAALEVGHTEVTPQMAKGMLVIFLLLIFAVPLWQTLFADSQMPASIPFKKQENASLLRIVPQWNNQLLESINAIETELEERSFLRSLLLKPGQKFLLALGYGNEKVYPGIADWLFFRPDMDYLMGAPFLDDAQIELRSASGKLWESKIQPDPLLAITHFKKTLATQGIELILVPTPVKASLHPEKFYGDVIDQPLQNRSWNHFLKRLQQENIMVFDPAVVLASHLQTESGPLYLQTDTHWRPEAMEQTARKLAEFITTSIDLSRSNTDQQQREETVTSRGDIDAMLLLSEKDNPFPRETVEIQSVLSIKNELWQSDSNSEILLLGDSFSNIYSLSGMGWGAGAGFAEQLSFYLQCSLDTILQNDAGAFATREFLSKELAGGRDRLKGKKVVIWQFATRELSSGDWKIIDMDYKARSESDFYIPAPAEEKEVTALLSAISSSPFPGSVPYKDNILTLHLTDIRDKQTGAEYGQALVYTWGMQDNTLTATARIRVGTRLDMKLIDWDSVQGKYSSYRRSTLKDEMLELELPVWGELIQ